MTVLTYNHNLNDVESSHGYFDKRIIPCGVNTAVISTVMKTNSVYGEGGVMLILLLHLSIDSRVILTQINISHGVFLEPKCAACYVKVTVLAYSLLLGQDPRRNNICNIDLLKQRHYVDKRHDAEQSY